MWMAAFIHRPNGYIYMNHHMEFEKRGNDLIYNVLLNEFDADLADWSSETEKQSEALIPVRNGRSF